MKKTNFESYMEGINESWKVFKELFNLSQDAIAEIFYIPSGMNAKQAVFDLSPEAVIREYKEHQAKLKREKEIGVGDVVYHVGNKEKGMVMEVLANEWIRVYTQEKELNSWNPKYLKKCNKHIEVIDWIIQGIEEAEVL